MNWILFDPWKEKKHHGYYDETFMKLRVHSLFGEKAYVDPLLMAILKEIGNH